MSYGITPTELKIIQSFLTGDYHVILFGSRIKGGWRKFSDLDICLKSKIDDEKIDMLELSNLREKFEQSDLIYTVDLVDYHRCNPEFKKIIDKTGVDLNALC